MLKKALAAVLCGVLTTACFTGCGNGTKTVGDSDDTDTNTSSSTSSSDTDTDTEDSASYVISEVANFTTPEEGEQIIIMNIQDYGEVKIKLFPEYASEGVENFVELAKEGYYDGLTFHRVISDFMIQGGDPTGTGTGGESIWGGKFDGGTDSHLIHAAGALAYANSGDTSTNGSQFYIVTGALYDADTVDQMGEYYGVEYSDEAKYVYAELGGTPWLDGYYTIFGQVYEGLDIIYEIQDVETDSNDKPVEDVIIESVTVGEYDGEELHWYISDYE
ncbi:MAG: peptidylprolyl isomerase [Ruminococcus sp.]|nr:peptidylprolyl isomerase [Ruminococcus sp.]